MNSALFTHNDVQYKCDHIVAALRGAGIQASDSVYVHSALVSFGKLVRGVKRNAFTGAFIDALREVLGSKGNLMMPTFSYSFCKREVFDVRNTPSKVGLLTEAFRKASGVKRSAEGIFSSAAEGPDTDFFLDVGKSCFGAYSIFEKLYDRNAKFVLLGDTFDLTFIHFAEQRLGVPYRYVKAFPGIVLDGTTERETVCYYNVRYLDYDVEYDMNKLGDSMQQASIVQTAPLAASSIRSVTAKDAYDHIIQGLSNDLGFLLKEAPTLPPHAVAITE